MREWLNSVKGVTKHQIQSREVIILGELHDQSIICSRTGTGMSVYEYVNKRAADNDKLLLLLEFNRNTATDYSRIGSKIIRDVFTGGTNNVRDKTRGVDIRLDCISQNDQNILYNDDPGFYHRYVDSVLRRRCTTPDALLLLRATYVDPYYKSLLECKGDDELLRYKSDLTKTFDDLKTKLEVSGTLFITDHHFRDEIISTMRWGWARLMDFEILREIRADDKSTEIIIAVVGNNHRKNIRDVMRGWKDSTELLNVDERTEKECISTFKLK